MSSQVSLGQVLPRHSGTFALITAIYLICNNGDNLLHAHTYFDADWILIELASPAESAECSMRVAFFHLSLVLWTQSFDTTYSDTGPQSSGSISANVRMQSTCSANVKVKVRLKRKKERERECRSVRSESR